MQVAIIHDTLVEFGGAERVLRELLAIFPEAHVYTAYYDPIFLAKFFPRLERFRFHGSWAQTTPLVRHGSLFQCFSPLVWKSFNLKSFDLVFSVTSYMMANLVNARFAKHVQYILAPPKNLYGLDQQFPLQKFLPYAGMIRREFEKSIHSTPYILADSLYIKHTLEDLFGVQAKVIYPPVRIPGKILPKLKPAYYLIVSRIDSNKRLEIAIEACNILREPLKIVGTSADPEYEKHLRLLAGPTIDFLGFQSDQAIDLIYQSAKAFIFTSKNEDFGIAPVEALAHGVPVISYYGGGVKETLISGLTGEFFYEDAPGALVNVLKSFNSKAYTNKTLLSRAKMFTQVKFKKQLDAYLGTVLS